jgi:PHD/YefM family antitoxin component YafN of YafNO toxin-antitoxin module
MVVSSVAPLQPAGEIHGSSAEQNGLGTLSRTRASTNRALTTLSATEARKRLYALIDEMGQSHEPVQITGKRSNAVLLSPDDWRAIQETLHLVSIPGMRESILEGMATEVSELSSEPLW